MPRAHNSRDLLVLGEPLCLANRHFLLALIVSIDEFDRSAAERFHSPILIDVFGRKIITPFDILSAQSELSAKRQYNTDADFFLRGGGGCQSECRNCTNCDASACNLQPAHCHVSAPFTLISGSEVRPA